MVAALWLCLGCTQEGPPVPTPHVIKCGSTMISPQRFGDELELKLAAYPFDLKASPLEYNAVVLDLVSVLSDEVVLLEGASEKGITVSADEIKKAEDDVREDYPEDSFEQMLLENAISYEAWKKNIEKDMVIKKFVQADLIDAQEITPDDVVAFYKEYEKTHPSGSPLAEKDLVRQLRMEKSQDAYGAWIGALKDRHPIEIDKKAVAAFLVKTKQK